MEPRPRLKDLFATLWYSLRHDEQVRAFSRFALVVGAIAALGILGGQVVAQIPPASERFFDRNQGCAYDAASAQGAQAAPSAQAAPGNQPITPGQSVMTPPGAKVFAQWFIRNTGSCSWDSQVTFQLTDRQTRIQVMTDTLSVPPFGFPNNTAPSIPPGGTLAPVVSMIAPQAPGSYVTTWRLFAPDGVHWFGPEFTFTIEVATGIEGVVPAAPKYFVDWWFVIPALIGVFIALLRAGAFVTQMYSLHSLKRGFYFVLNTVFGLAVGQSALIVYHGEYEGRKTDEQEVLLKIGGPGVLFIKADTAVLTERGAGYSRVLGPEGHTLMPFERIRMIYDLRTQSFDSVETGLTREGIPIRAGVSTMFRFMKRMPDEPPSSPQHPRFMSVLSHYVRRTPPGSVKEPPVSPEALRLAYYEIHRPASPIKWTSVAHGAVAGEVREELGRRTLDQIFAPEASGSSPRREIAAKLFKSGSATLAGRGLELIDSSFANIQLPREVIDLRTNMWQAGWEKESTIARSASEAEGLLQMQTARAEAQAEIIKSIVQAARNMDQNNQLSKHVVEALARAVESTLQHEANLPLLSSTSHKDFDQMLERLRRLSPPGS